MAIHKPLHPGLIVKDALIDNTDLTVSQAAIMLDVNRATLSRLINCRAGISAEMAERLAQFFNTTAESWLNLQTQYDIWLIKHQPVKIKIKPFRLVA